MSIKSFIERANDLASKNNPFFFVIDFEQKKPLIYTPEVAKNQNVFLTLPGVKTSNISPRLEKSSKLQPKIIFKIDTKQLLIVYKNT
ncbi:hypothetical protein OAQ15_00455 [Flavobacteriaceae bacterium]|nr:hypothetical protein [Flavobacteriaceae bacterium]